MADIEYEINVDTSDAMRNVKNLMRYSMRHRAKR